MEKLDGITEEMRRLLAMRQERRQELARWPFPKKVEAVVKLQELAASILRARGKTVFPWRMEKAESRDAER